MQPITLTSLFVTFLALLPNLALANPEENAAQMPCKGRLSSCNNYVFGETCCPPLVCRHGMCGNPPDDA